MIENKYYDVDIKKGVSQDRARWLYVMKDIDKVITFIHAIYTAETVVEKEEYIVRMFKAFPKLEEYVSRAYIKDSNPEEAFITVYKKIARY